MHNKKDGGSSVLFVGKAVEKALSDPGGLGRARMSIEGVNLRLCTIRRKWRDPYYSHSEIGEFADKMVLEVGS